MIVAFDLGTCFCRAACIIDNQCQILCKFPSVICYNEDEYYIGNSAIKKSLNFPTSTIYESKRIFESNFGGETTKEKAEFELYKTLWPFKVESSKKGTYEYNFGEFQETPEEVLNLFITHMKYLSEKELGEEITDVVITIPNYFTNTHRVATQELAKKLGLNVKRILTDTSAIAFEYGIKRDQDKGKQIVLLYSIGGSCANVSLVIVDGSRIETKAASCNKFIGGIDFENEVIRLCCAKAKQLFGVPILSDKLAMLKLKYESQKVIQGLSKDTSYLIEIPSLFEDKDFKWNFTRETFEKANKKRIDELLDPVFDVLEHSEITKDKVDEIVLVGGASRIPKVKQTLERLFKGKNFVESLDPDLCVVSGAAIHAELLSRIEEKK